MGLFGGKKRAISHETAKLGALQMQSSSFGQPFVLQFGTGRLYGKPLWAGDFTPVAHTTSETTGGKGGGGSTTTTNTTYTYNTAADLFLCIGKVKGLLSVWDVKGKRKTLGLALFNSTIPASPAYTRQPVGTGFLMDLGCGLVANRTVTANDYGDDTFGHGGRSVSIVSEVTPMTRVVSAPAAGQYSVDETTGIYTFNAADASKAIQIQYVAVTGTLSPAAQYGFTFFDGSQSAAWGYMTTKHPGQDLVYKLFARAVNGSIDCGESGTLPNFSWEVVGLVPYPGQLDAHPHDIISYALTDSIMGIGFPGANLDANTLYKNYCTANGLFLSPALDTQEEFRNSLNQLLELTNSDAFMSEGLLKIRPYGDQTVIGNGATYTPDTTPIYDLTLDDFIAADDEPPVVWTRAAQADAFNSVSLEYLNRANEYNIEVIEERDSAQVETFGLRKQDPIQAHAVKTKAVAALILNTLLKKQMQNRGTGKFVVGFQYCGLEPMNIVTITVPKLNFIKKPVRITHITENDDRTFEMEVEEFPYASASATLYPKGEGSGFSPNTNNDPGSVATPVIYEPPARATQDGLGNEVWVGAYGTSADWGGADLWISNDNISYRKLITPVPGKMRSGITASTLVAAADPDTVDTIDVDLSGSGGALVNASVTDCDNFRSLMLIGNELMSFQNATLLGANQYRLGTRIRRGVYGTPITSHAVSERVVRIDDNIVKLKFKAEDVGQTFYLKFASYNTFGRAEQDISTLSPYSFVLGGVNGGNDFIPTELVHDALVLQASATGAGTLLVQIAGTVYTVVAGDTLEYDVWIDPSSADYKAGVDIIFSDLSTLRGSGYRDQVPLSADPSTDLSAYAKSAWFHRKIDLSRAAGKITGSWLIGFDGSSVGFHRAKFANIRIMNGKTVKATSWITGVPAFSIINTNTNYTIGTTPLYSQNDGGQWYAMLTAGLSSGMNLQGSIIPTPSSSTPFAYTTQDDGSAFPTIIWRWVTITCYRPDASTFNIPNSQTQWTAIPLAPVLSQAAGGARAAATLFARVAYVKDGMIVGIGKQNSLAVLINNNLSIAAPGNPAPRASSVMVSDTFAGVNGTLLSAHASDVSLGSGNGVGNVWTRTITANDFKLNGSGKILLTTASTSQAAYLPDAAPQQDGYTAQVDIDFSASASNGDFGGLQVRALDGNNYYFISVRGNGLMRIEKKIASVVTVIQADTAISLKVGTMKVVVSSPNATTTQLDCYWNGTLIFSKQDTARTWKYGEKAGISSGSVAVMTFANFSVDDGISTGNPVSAYDGWVPLVGTTSGFEQCQVDPRTPLAFNVGWTEPTAGATHIATLITGNTKGANFNAATDLTSGSSTSIFTGAMSASVLAAGGLLAYNTTYRYYPAAPSASPFVPMRMFGNGVSSTTISQVLNALMLGDKFIAMANVGGMTAITASAAGGTGGGGGGGCPKTGHRIFAEHGMVYATPYKNSNWSLVRTEQGGIFQVVPRHRWTTLRGLVRSQDLRPGEDFLRVIMRETKEKKWLRVLSQDNVIEETTAEGVLVDQQDRLYYCGAPESTCDAEGHNLKP